MRRLGLPLILLAACSGDTVITPPMDMAGVVAKDLGQSAGAYHCSSSAGTCAELPSGTTLMQAQNACNALAATVVVGACSTVAALGWCDVSVAKMWFYSTYVTESTAIYECGQLGGVWNPI